MTFTPTPLLRAYLSRFLMAALLFAILGMGMDNTFERGHSGDFQKAALQVCDVPHDISDSTDLELFLPRALAAPAFTIALGPHHAIPMVMPVQAIYSPPPRPPAFA